MAKDTNNRLIYAVNSMGQLVGIDDVPTGLNCSCFCPACKQPLIAKNQGKNRTHHFAHHSGVECDYAVESMLHILAKEIIREAFLSSSEFWIEFESKVSCSNTNNCKYIRYGVCTENKKNRFNLKEFYDSCEQETPYDNINRRSDLKIFSSSNPNRTPIYLEFCVTHASDSEKLHSGNKIIEIDIEAEEDIFKISQYGIIESHSTYNEGYGSFSPRVVFYGFKNKDSESHSVSSEIEFIRYILYNSGKSQCFQDTCNCRKLAKSKPFSKIEICIHTDVSFGVYDEVKYIGYSKYGMKNCILCSNYVDSYNGMGKICRLYKRLEISRYETFDTARAVNCSYFKINRQEMEAVLRNGLSYPFTIFE